MYVIMFKVKLYCVEVIYVVFDYEGFCVIDGDWLDFFGICEYEQIQIYNVDNGECFIIYVICVENGLKMILVNGVVVYKVKVGDCVIICVYVYYSEVELVSYKLCMLYMVLGNQFSYISEVILIQVV